MKPWPSPTPDAITFSVARPDIQDQDVQRVLIELKKGNVSGATPTIQEAESLLKTAIFLITLDSRGKANFFESWSLKQTYLVVRPMNFTSLP